jgi:hypothetical protein
MTFNFNVEVVLKGRDFAVTEAVTIPHGEPGTWNDAAVKDALIGIIRAIGRVEQPNATAERQVILRGFSWIVEPEGDHVVIAIEIPMGAAVAGPFAIGQAELDSMISRVLRTERQAGTGPGQTIH